MAQLFTNGPLSTLDTNPLSYYHLRDQPWTEQEDQQLRTEYVDQSLDIIQIADLHYKTPGQVSYRLKKLGITEKYYKDTRGYERYKDSALFREIMLAPKTRVRKEKQIENDEKQEKKGRPSKIKLIEEYLQIQQEQKEKIDELTIEIKSMKQDVKEILRLMNAVYDFEVQL